MQNDLHGEWDSSKHNEALKYEPEEHALTPSQQKLLEATLGGALRTTPHDSQEHALEGRMEEPTLHNTVTGLFELPPYSTVGRQMIATLV